MSVKRWGVATTLLLGLTAGGGIVAATGQDAGTAGPATPLGSWVSENSLVYYDLDPAADYSDEELEELAEDPIISQAFLPDGTWIVHDEDALGAVCYHATWQWVADGDTLRVPGRADLRWHFSLNDDRSLLILTSPVGNVGVFLADDAQPDTTGCRHEPGMLPFW